MKKINIFEIEQQLAAAKAEYHAASQTETAGELAARSAHIKKLTAAVNAYYTEGAEGEDLIGMKVRPGVYEIGNGTNRSRGETRDEAVANWNSGDFWLR